MAPTSAMTAPSRSAMSWSVTRVTWMPTAKLAIAPLVVVLVELAAVEGDVVDLERLALRTPQEVGMDELTAAQP